MQTDSRTSSLTEPSFSTSESLETISILPHPAEPDETGQRHHHFAAPIVLGPIEDDRQPINLFVQGTASRVVQIRASLGSFSMFDSELMLRETGMSPKDRIGNIMLVLRRRRLIADLSRVEYIIVAGGRLLDDEASVDDSGLSNDSVIEIRVRVRGGSTRLVSERK